MQLHLQPAAALLYLALWCIQVPALTVFPLLQVYCILDEFIIGGEIQETSKKVGAGLPVQRGEGQVEGT